MKGCDVGGDGGWNMLCSNPCRIYPDYIHYSEKSKVCYTTFAQATAGVGTCNIPAVDDTPAVRSTWCTYDINIGSGCGNNRF